MKRRRIFFFSFCCGAFCSDERRNWADGAAVLLSKHQSYAEGLAHLHYNGFLSSSVIGVWSPMAMRILQTNDLDFWIEGRAAVWPSIHCNLNWLTMVLVFLVISFQWGIYDLMFDCLAFKWRQEKDFQSASQLLSLSCGGHTSAVSTHQAPCSSDAHSCRSRLIFHILPAEPLVTFQHC